MSSPYLRLREFIDQRMRMSHIYQPVMLDVLLTKGGVATSREIAAAILAHDESQLDYYEQVVKNMPGRVLRSHGIVERIGNDYRLAPEYAVMTPDERAELRRLCEQALQNFKAKRGAAIWEHRRPGLGVIPGRVRYETLKQAGFRCELCGISADERALDVDHILPRSNGGSDDPANLQALCWLCNTNKGAGDDTDFRSVRGSYAERTEGCPFCALEPERVIRENALAVLIEDRFPVTTGHLLAITRRHVPDYFALYAPELRAIQELIGEGQRLTLQRHPEVAGFNVGINSAEAAGQTIMHCHVHLIPRRLGDVDNPRGGVRGVIPAKQYYGESSLSGI